MASHGMARQVSPTRVRLESLLGQVKHLHGIKSTPVFPVESVRTAVGGGDDVQAGLGGIGLRLTDPFDGRAMESQDKPRTLAIGLRRARGIDPHRRAGTSP